MSVSVNKRAMRLGWEEAGHRVRGAALGWFGARSLQDATGIRSQALVSLERDIQADPELGRAADPLTGLDVLVVDETGIGHIRRSRLVTAAREARARLVLVREPCQREKEPANA